MQTEQDVSDSVQDFESIIYNNDIYVDKTGYLAKLIGKGRKTWFLSRPRRFGKSLTISTLDAIFSGKKELFKGLAIENRLDEELFAPRPVIHLDMSKIKTTLGINSFNKSLNNNISMIAEELEVEMPQYEFANDLLSALILRCSRKFDSKVAVLVDEYDAPVTNLAEKPEEAEAVRQELRQFYTILKAQQKYLSFVFVTGITKYVKGGLYSAFNNPTDISFFEDYGALTGFTHDELTFYYGRQIEEVAEMRKTTTDKLLEEIKYHYNGFCFDGHTQVYNPFSTLLFFQNKEFLPFWFSSGSPKQLIDFLSHKKLKFENFQNFRIKKNTLREPDEDMNQQPAVYLFQLGYLTIIPTKSEDDMSSQNDETDTSNDDYILDYPNTEVRCAMARHLMNKYYENIDEANSVRDNFRDAVENRDPAKFIAQLNSALEHSSYDWYQTGKRDEYFYGHVISLLLYATNSKYDEQKHSVHGRADFIVHSKKHSWVIELKVAHDNDDAKRAAEAMSQIIETQYASGLADPVLLGIAVNDEARTIKHWECRGGLAERPMEPSGSADEGETADGAKALTPRRKTRRP